MKKHRRIIRLIVVAVLIIAAFCPFRKKVNKEVGAFSIQNNEQVSITLNGYLYRSLINGTKYVGEIEVSSMEDTKDYQFNFELPKLDWNKQFLVNTFYYNRVHSDAERFRLTFDSGFNLLCIDTENEKIIIGAKDLMEAFEIKEELNLWLN